MKRCKFVNKKGKRCLHRAVLKGYCTTHIKKMIEEKKIIYKENE